jgi:4'-phosphopantetheinyl transferase
MAPLLPLPAGRIDVWLTPLAAVGADEQHRYAGLLNPAEDAAWRRFKVTGAALQHLVARALVRTTLSRYAAVPPLAWEFARNAHGRPHVAAPAEGCDLLFNLSHTDGLVALAIGRACEFGIDVEHMPRRVEAAELAPRFFAPPEAAHVVAASGAEQRDRFFAFWTLKEAYIKARGMGLALPLDSFWYDLDGPQIHFTDRCPDDPRRWHFFRTDPTPEHRLALAVAATARPEIRLQEVIP